MKKFLKNILPDFSIKLIQRIKWSFLLIWIQKKHQQALIRVQKKDRIKVAFFLIHRSVWKYDSVYKLMEQNDRIEPVVVVCPCTTYGKQYMMEEMNKAYAYSKRKGYTVVKTFNEENGKWMNVKKEILPDIVFFTNPHHLTKDDYYITNFLDTLTCYVQYSFHITHLNKMQYDQPFHNFIWKAFYETPIHLTMAKQNSRNRAKNVIITGYPGIDIFLDKNHRPKNIWKILNPDIKKIIWAPHHTINENECELGYSTFLKYASWMLKIAQKYSEQIQIAFKPHPFLKVKLYNHPEWGKKKTDQYYKNWCVGKNTLLVEGDYVDLFLTSDAMIHDSGSFLIEYLYMQKPTLFCIRNKSIANKFNTFGKLAFNVHYKAFNKNDILFFLEDSVIKERDVLVNQRSKLLKNYLIPPNNQSASKNIMDFINSHITIKN